MHVTRSVLGVLFAAALTLPITACDAGAEETFEETPPTNEQVEPSGEEPGRMEQDRAVDRDTGMRRSPVDDGDT